MMKAWVMKACPSSSSITTPKTKWTTLTPTVTLMVTPTVTLTTPNATLIRSTGNGTSPKAAATVTPTPEKSGMDSKPRRTRKAPKIKDW